MTSGGAPGYDVRTTMVDGEVLVDDFRLVREDLAEIISQARSEARALALRASRA